MSSYSLSVLDDSYHVDELETIDTSSMHNNERSNSSLQPSSSRTSSHASHDDSRRIIHSRGGGYLRPMHLSYLRHNPSSEDSVPLPVHLPPRRPFRFPARQSSSGKHLLVRPLAKPRFHARFGERPMAGVLLADEAGVEVPHKLRAGAVSQPSSMDPQKMPSFILGRKDMKPNKSKKESLSFNNYLSSLPMKRVWQEDPYLDLDELSEWVPEWATRLSRTQILDVEAIQAYEALRASSSRSRASLNNPHRARVAQPIRIFKSGGYILSHLEAMLVQSRLSGALVVTRTIKDADCVVAKNTWSDGRGVNLSHHMRAARNRGIPFLLVDSLKARELVLKLRPLLIERGILDQMSGLMGQTSTSQSQHKLISLSADHEASEVKETQQWQPSDGPAAARSRMKQNMTSDIQSQVQGRLMDTEEIFELQVKVLRGEMTLPEFTMATRLPHDQ